MFQGLIVEHLTSWLTINPYKGCPLACAYCFRARWHPSDVPEQTQDVAEAVEALIRHPNFRANETPVSINNSSTDPLLPAVKPSTFKAIGLLDSKHLRNPFAIISKLELKPKDVEFLQELRFVRPIMFVSLSLMPKNIEPAPIPPRLRTLRRISLSRIPCVLYFRPIVKDLNDSPEVISTVLRIGARYCDAICIGSLRVSPEIRTQMTIRGVQIDNYEDDFHRKLFLNDIEDRILGIYDQMKLSVPLFKHSSCAVSYLLTSANYNFLFNNPEKNCVRTCPASQQNLCRPQE